MEIFHSYVTRGYPLVVDGELPIATFVFSLCRGNGHMSSFAKFCHVGCTTPMERWTSWTSGTWKMSLPQMGFFDDFLMGQVVKLMAKSRSGYPIPFLGKSSTSMAVPVFDVRPQGIETRLTRSPSTKRVLLKRGFHVTKLFPMAQWLQYPNHHPNYPWNTT